MSVKVRISYETDAEIDRILELLSPMGMRVKMPVKKGERFLRAYLYDKPQTAYNDRPVDLRPIGQQYPI